MSKTRRRGQPLQDKLGDGGRQLRHLLDFAIRAPSIQNTQPWRFRLQGDELFVVADHSRKLEIADPNGRELAISVGAAIGHIEIAAAALGIELAVTLMPDPDSASTAAHITVVGECAVAADAVPLKDAMLARHTVRAAFYDQPVAKELQGLLGKAAAGPGTRLVGLNTDHAKGAVAGLVAEADRRNFRSQDYRKEQADWTLSSHSEREDGVPAEAQGMGRVAGLVAPLVLRLLDSGERHATADAEQVSSAPMLVMVVTHGDLTRDWLEAGRSLSRLLLTATANELKASFFSQPLQVRSFRLRIRSMLPDRAWPQLLLRLGYGPVGVETPRRAVSEVVKVRAKGQEPWHLV